MSRPETFGMTLVSDKQQIHDCCFICLVSQVSLPTKPGHVFLWLPFYFFLAYFYFVFFISLFDYLLLCHYQSK